MVHTQSYGISFDPWKVLSGLGSIFPTLMAKWLKVKQIPLILIDSNPIEEDQLNTLVCSPGAFIRQLVLLQTGFVFEKILKNPFGVLFLGLLKN